MKILIVNTVPFNRNGISTVIMNYFNFLVMQNKIDFVINDKIEDDYKQRILKSGSKIYNFGNRNKNPINYVNQLRKLLKREQYEVIYVHGNSATMAVEVFAARKLQLKLVAHAHNVKTEHPAINKILKPYFLKHIDLAFAASEQAGKFLFESRKFEVIPNGICLEDFYYSEENRKKYRKKFDITKDQKLIVQLGTFTEQKNYEFSIELVNLLREEKVHFLFFGEGKLKNKIEENINKKNLTQKVSCFPPLREVNQLLSAADGVILPSLWEGLPLTGLEVQAAGVNFAVSNNLNRDLNITNSISFLNLDTNKWKEWVMSLENRAANREDIIVENKRLIREANFDITKNAQNMMEMLKILDN